jgi:hypothetical protein
LHLAQRPEQGRFANAVLSEQANDGRAFNAEIQIFGQDCLSLSGGITYAQTIGRHHRFPAFRLKPFHRSFMLLVFLQVLLCSTFIASKFRNFLNMALFLVLRLSVKPPISLF